MTPIFRRWVRSVPETYVLNLAQMGHILFLAVFVPWMIGLEEYGRFAATIAVPGFIQSSFEVFCVAVLSRYKRRDLLVAPVRFVLLPIAAIIGSAFFLLLDFFIAILACLLMLSLFFRSYAFALAISSGRLTGKIVRSEAIVFAGYLLALALCGIVSVYDQTTPMIMVFISSVLSGSYLLWRSRSVGVARPDSNATAPRLPLGVAATAASARLFEDGLLSLSPLILATVLTPTIAGQFRLFVSAVKAIYKVFPFRYEVVLRETSQGHALLRQLAVASIIFISMSVSASLVGFISIGAPRDIWLFVLGGSAGAAAASLSLYPAACNVDGRMPIACLAMLTLMFGLAATHGAIGFSLGFAAACHLIVMLSLVTLRFHQGKAKAKI